VVKLRRPVRLAAALTAAIAILAAAAAAPASGTPAASTPTGLARPASLPKVTHIWVIVLENAGYQNTFGAPGTDPYLARTLPSKGALLENYYGIGHRSADNYLAMVSGQPPNPDTQADCQRFAAFGTSRTVNGIATGDGCVYPSAVRTIGNQLTAAHRSWKAYEQDMGNLPAREQAACGHPAIGALDPTSGAVRGDGYATRHDPFVYFRSIIGSPPYCDAHVVALGSPGGSMPHSALRGETGLATDLRSARTTPAYSFITPNLCADGHDFPCRNAVSGRSAGADRDAFLEAWVPRIMASDAYRRGGLIEIVFDEADGTPDASAACCNERPGPAAPEPGGNGPGGGRVGAVLLSPFIRPGTVSAYPYNHYSLLASDERLLGLRLLGDARSVPRLFGPDVFTRP
jgi:hypothetical protein